MYKRFPIVAISNSTCRYVYYFRLPIIRTLRKEGYDVVIVAPIDQYAQKLKDEGFEVIPFTLYNKSVNPFTELITILRYIKVYKKVNPSLILHYTPKPNIYGSLAARILRIPTINNIAGLGTAFIGGSLLSFIVKYLYKLTQKSAYRVFFQNKDDMQLFLDSGIVQKERANLLPGSGIDVNEFSLSHSAEKSELTFLLISRLIWDKGIAEYAEAARIVKAEYLNASFILLGYIDYNNPRGIPEETIRQWTREGILTWVGEQDNVKPFIADADCVVLPSYREGTPRSLLEAASMGKPLIAADSIGTREPVEDGVNGYLCKLKDSEDLAEKMIRIIKMPYENRLRMGKQSRRKMEEEYDMSIVVSKYLDTIKQVFYK